MSRKNSPLENSFEKLIVRRNLTFPQKGHPFYCLREYRWYRLSRFDFAWPNVKVAVECQSKKYHKTPSQLERDRWKLNIAQVQGWIVFHFSSTFLSRNPEIALNLLEKALRCRIES